MIKTTILFSKISIEKFKEYMCIPEVKRNNKTLLQFLTNEMRQEGFFSFSTKMLSHKTGRNLE